MEITERNGVKQDFDYARKSAELDGLLEALGDTNLPLDKALILHAHAQDLVAEIEQYLKNAENHIRRVLDDPAKHNTSSESGANS